MKKAGESVTMTKLSEIKKRLEKATPGPRMGRTEEWQGKLVWAIYEGRERQDGFAGKAPLGFIREHGDAMQFKEAPQDIEYLLGLVDELAGALSETRKILILEHGQRVYEVNFKHIEKALIEYIIADGGEK